MSKKGGKPGENWGCPLFYDVFSVKFSQIFPRSVNERTTSKCVDRNHILRRSFGLAQ